MRRLALVTTLALLGSVGAVAAQPSPPAAPDQRRPDYDDPYRDRNPQRWHRDVRGRWIPLGLDFSAFQQGQQIVVYGRGGPMRRLRIRAERGAPVITRVTVEFVGNFPGPQITNVNRRLPPGAVQDVPLNGNRGIKRIIVYTESRFGGRYSVFGT